MCLLQIPLVPTGNLIQSGVNAQNVKQNQPYTIDLLGSPLNEESIGVRKIICNQLAQIEQTTDTPFLTQSILPHLDN
jgi:hypothetical protein